MILDGTLPESIAAAARAVRCGALLGLPTETVYGLAADASKIALAYLVRHLQARGAPWIDCQQETPHLASLGARPVVRPDFLAMLAAGRDAPAPAWGSGRLRADGRLDAPPSGLPARPMPQ